MAAVLEENPANVGMPGYMRGTVGDHDDATLRDQLQADLSEIARVLSEFDSTPNKDGLPPSGWDAVVPRGRINNVGAVERMAQRVLAIRQTLVDREGTRAAEAEATRDRARDALERLLAEAPAKAQGLIEAAREGQAAADRMRQLLADFETVGQLAELAATHAHVVDGTREAANALGKKPPEIPEMDAEPLSREEIQDLQALFRGKRAGAGWNRTHRPGDFAKAREIAAELK